MLRLRDGEVVSMVDGRGGWCPASWVGGGRLAPLAESVQIAAPRPEVTIAMAVPKGDRAEWAVAKLTELGVDRIIPLTTARAVVRWDEAKVERSVGRWRSVARGAAMQSRRLTLPVITGPLTPALLVQADATLVVMAEPDGSTPSLARPVVLIGPEGGWSEEELALGLPTAGLVPTVLRTETAAVTAAVIMIGLRSGLVAAAGAELASSDP